MIVVLTMKQVYLCHQCAESDLLYQTYLPKPCFLISISTMVNLAVVYANIQGGMTSKHVEGCMNTGPLVLWLSEQHKKPGCLQKLRRQEALQCLVLKEKMCLSIGWHSRQFTDWLAALCLQRNHGKTTICTMVWSSACYRFIQFARN